MANPDPVVGSNLAVPQLLLLHEMPGRCRLRVSRLGADSLVRENIAQRLKTSPMVAAFRFNMRCDSVTVEHHGPVENLFALLLEFRNIAAPDDSDGHAVIKLTSAKKEKPLQALVWAAASLAMPASAGIALALVPLVVSGLPIWHRALATLVRERRLNVDFLDGLALAIALLRQQPRTGALMAVMVHLGDVIRERTARQSQSHIRQLLDFQTVQARRLVGDGTVTLVAAESLQADQMVLLLAGDLVPADGEVSDGFAAVDQRHITGESAPATRRVGEMVFAGSSVVEGSITIRITEAGSDTMVAKIVGLIKATPIGETRIQNYAEQFADRLVAPVLGANLALLAATANLDRFMSLAIVDYGTGIRIAAPTSILAAMTRAARSGILIKSGRHIEHLGNLRGVAFDKTGTLTSGRLTVLDVHAFGRKLSPDSILQLAAAAETPLRHPVAVALVSHARHIRHLDVLSCHDVQFSIGLGVAAEVAGRRVHVGSERYFQRLCIVTGKARNYLAEIERKGHTALLVALDDQLIGAIALNDEPRPEARAVVLGLRQRGVREIVMLTGDRDGVAKRIASSVGIDKVYSEVLPHDKAEIVRTLRAEHGPLAMIGDGVNDSPALAQADVGIALADGADIARAAADVILLEDGLHLLLPAIDISRDALALVRQNFALIAGANTLAMALALPSGWMSPVACTFLSNGSALLATANAMRPLLAVRQGNTFLSSDACSS